MESLQNQLSTCSDQHGKQEKTYPPALPSSMSKSSMRSSAPRLEVVSTLLARLLPEPTAADDLEKGSVNVSFFQGSIFLAFNQRQSLSIHVSLPRKLLIYCINGKCYAYTIIDFTVLYLQQKNNQISINKYYINYMYTTFHNPMIF